MLTEDDLVLMKHIAIEFKDYITLLSEMPDQDDTIEKLIGMLRKYELIIERERHVGL